MGIIGEVASGSDRCEDIEPASRAGACRKFHGLPEPLAISATRRFRFR